MYLVTNGDHGTSVSDKMVQKIKIVVNSRFFLRIFILIMKRFHCKCTQKSLLGGGGGGGGIYQL